MNQNGNTINGEPGDAFTTFISVETPDLAVHALTAPSLALAGQAANLIFTVTNSGTATALGGWRADFRLALTPSGSNATFLGSASVTNAILPGAFLTLTQGLVLPQGVAGTRYFGVVLDSLDQVLENNETNNVAWAPNGTGVSAPDLTVSNLVVAGSATLGGTTSVRWLRANIGSAATFVAGEDRIFLSAVSNSITGARQLAVVPGAVMAAGSSLTRTQIVSIPLETTLPAGNYFIVVAVDSPDAQPESDEGNNLASAAVRLNQPPLPDLAVVNLVTPLRFFPDAPQPVRWTVMNSGTLGLTNRVWRERISFSNALAGLVTLAEFDRSDTLPAGSFVERTEEVTFSTAWPPEPGFLFLTVDYFDAVVELTEANNVLRSDGAIPVTASLQLTFSPATLFEGSNVVTATLTRNGSTALPLHVTLSNNLPARLLMSNSVTIAAGASSAAFTIAAPWNGTVDGTVNVQIGATASNVLSAVKTLPLVDSSAPTLTLLLATNRLREGLSMPVTVSRGSAATQELVVLIGAFDPSSLTTPFSVTIPSNQVSVGFAVLAPDDTLFNGSRSNFVRAGAAGYEGATASLTVLDDDLPDVTLELSPAIVSENAGPQGANLTVRLSAPAVRNVVLDLVSSDPARARVPVSVSIPAGQIAASAPVEIIDNLQFGSNAPVQFQGFLHESGSTRHLAQTAIVTLQIRDDEGPSLALTLDRTLVNEGLSPATGARVARNGSTGGALVVQLSSSDTTEATVPASVTIPAGQLSTSFNVNSVQDNITDGAQRVTITASAAGYTAGSAELTVSDQDLPDLRVVSLTGPTNALAESTYTVTYRVENQGRVAAVSNLLTKIYLRTDPLGFGGIVVGSYTLAGALAPGQFFEQSLQGRFSSTLGRFYLVAVTDADGRNLETLEDNNVLISDPIEVSAPWTATVQTAITSAPAGTPIPMTGRAIRPGGGPVGNTIVSVHVVHRGLKRTLAALTDSSGNFTATFTPFPGEAGDYQIAAGHPGVEALAPQGTFTLLGFSVSPQRSRLELIEGQVGRGTLTVSNLSSIPLSGLTATVVSQPAGWNTAVTLTNNALPGNGSQALPFVVTPNSSGIGPILLRITAAGGISVDAVLEVAVAPLRTRFVATPGSLFAGMVRGQQTLVNFTLMNSGGAASGPINITLPSVPWLSVASPNPLPPLAPGETNVITLLLSPPADLDLVPFDGALLVSSGDDTINVPFQFRSLSDAKGDLAVRVVDELTYYAQGAPLVTNASVILRDPVTHEALTNLNTGLNGTVYLAGLAEGYYEVQVEADRHSTFRGNAFVSAGRTNQFEPFISRSLVEYVWSVVPTEIEDRTRIVIETTFETVVPLPVITVEPAFIDLSELPEPEAQIEIRISNHGLIAAPNVSIELPTEGGVTFETLATQLGTLPAQSSITVPVIIRQPTQSARSAQKSVPPSTRDRCFYYIRERHTLVCGPKTNVYYTTVAIRDSKASGCSGGGPGGGPGGGGGTIFNGGPLSPYGVASGGGDSVFFAPRVIKQKEKCGCEDFSPTCFEVGLGLVGGLANGAVNAALSPIGGSAKTTLTGSAKMCTCCDEEGEGLQLEAQAEVNASAEIPIPLTGANPTFHFTQGGYSGTIKAGIGCALIPKLELKGAAQLKTDCHLRNQRLCSSASGEVPIELTCSIGGEAEVEGLGKQAVQAFATLKSGVSVDYVQCDGTSSLRYCRKPVVFEAGFAFEIGNVAFSPKVSQELVAGAGYCETPVSPGPKSFGREEEAMRNMMEAIMDQVEASLRAQIEKEVAQRKLKYIVRPPVAAAAKSLSAPATGGDGICARVKLRIEQDLVMARNAFNATLELINRDPATPLDNIEVAVEVYDLNGRAVTDRFGFRKPTVMGLGAVDGSGHLGADSKGSASFILVPTSEAAPDGPTVYFVGGRLTYSLGGRTVAIPLTAAPITVYPDPRLRIQYFHQRDVFSDDPFTRDIIEPSIPYSLAVMVKNVGKGEAKKVRIISGQPKIVENERGLLIDFEIIATEVAGKSLSPSLTADFGAISPGGIGIGRWLLKSSLQGLFIDYKATFEHLDSLGKTNLSLVDEVTIHEMNHLVQATGAFEDGKPDFLVNDDPDPDDLPDHIYLSDGTTNRVSVVHQATIDAPPTAGGLRVTLTAEMPGGWGYLRVKDPANGAFQLLRVIGSDGRELPVNTNVWVTDRTFIGRSERPIRENILHLLDYGSTGSYTLIYGPLAAADFTAPSSYVMALPLYSNAGIPVSWTGSDAGGGYIALYDIYVAENYGPFVPWLQRVTVQGSIYAGLPGRRYEFYSIATDNSGNREPAPIYADAQTVVALSNSPPSLTLNAPEAIDEGETLTITATASDPDMPAQSLLFTLVAGPAGATINPSTGRIQWSTGEGNGPSTNLFRVVARDNGLPPLSATSSVTVIVREVNSAPVLSPIADRTISEGSSLRITNVVSDSDLPANLLTFSLGAGSPPGTTLHPQTGLFQWRPTETQGGTNYTITIIVRDDGVPSLSATQRFNVIVRDTLGDFSISLGRTNLYRGATSSVPVRLSSGIELTNIRFAVEQPITALTNLNLVPLSPELGSATLTPEGSNRSAIVFTSGAGQSLQGNQALASLRFTALSNGPSLILPLLVKGIEARRLDGALVANPEAQDGRVIIVGVEPVLEGRSTPNGVRHLTFYGNVGISYEIQAASTIPSGSWQHVMNVQATAPAMDLVLPSGGSNTFYRALRLGP